MTETADRPLVTFAIIAYNQEKFIREAVEGAFAQTYQPLEIILSDDCSSDRTFEIMKEMAEAYKGPHTVVLNQNFYNTGVCSHVSKAARLATGELLVLAAGDDVSLPDRTKVLKKVYIKHRERYQYILSGARKMDDNGHLMDSVELPPKQEKQTFLTSLVSAGVGATSALTPWLIRDFGDLPSPSYGEVLPLKIRAFLFGKVKVTNEILVHHRVHENALSSREAPESDCISYIANRRYFYGAMLLNYAAVLADLVTIQKAGRLKQDDAILAITETQRLLDVSCLSYVVYSTLPKIKGTQLLSLLLKRRGVAIRIFLLWVSLALRRRHPLFRKQLFALGGAQETSQLPAGQK